MSGRIVGVKVRWRLGELEIELAQTEAELMALAAGGQKAPNGWDISAMAVAVAAARDFRAMREQIDSLEADVAQLTRIATAAGLIEPAEQTADFFSAAVAALKPGGLQAVPDVYTEPDPAELEADYNRRLAKAQALAGAGVGWAGVVELAGLTSSALRSGARLPDCAELRTIEQWLNQNATRKGEGSL